MDNVGLHLITSDSWRETRHAAWLKRAVRSRSTYNLFLITN